MVKKLIYIFHNGHVRNSITRDCRIRIEAAKQIALKNPNAAIFFVGGNGISGARDMQNFWQKQYPDISNELFLLEKANNTADAVKEIIESRAIYENKEKIMLISSAYHVKRISFFVKVNDLKADVVAAEDVLESETNSFEIKSYRSSYKYKLKIIADLIILLYASTMDRGQRLVSFWRKYTRMWK